MKHMNENYAEMNKGYVDAGPAVGKEGLGVDPKGKRKIETDAVEPGHANQYQGHVDAGPGKDM
ncbi:hypothetical protein J2S20_002238 [Moryella indoligenes]|uniref:Uncharacterized protein n=1 Tax=Moryella indoligenes TaxID=371674 RepID=A0AAE3VCC8_9FIRM|nr:hypothetical protein [Moryella indoligenes]MDQ0153517.1 hypothetical protein [Moryella indoligenes]